MIIFFVFITLVLLIGHAAILPFRPQTETLPSLHFSLSAILGLGVLGYVLFIVSLGGFCPSRLTLSMLIVGTIGIHLATGFAAFRPYSCKHYGRPAKREFFIYAMLFLLFAANLFPICVHALGHVNFQTDAWILWGFKARVVSCEPVREASYFHDLHYGSLHLNYPLMVPFLMAGINAISGQIEETLSKLIFPVVYVLYLAAIYTASRISLRPLAAFACSVLTGSLPFVTAWAGSGYVDLALAAFMTSASLCFLIWLKQNAQPFLVLGVIFTVFSTFTKNEGLAFAIIVFLSLLLTCTQSHFKSQRRLVFQVIALCCVLLLPWLTFRAGLPSIHENYALSFRSGAIYEAFSRVGPVLAMFIKAMFLEVSEWGIYWYLFIFSAYLGRRAFRQPEVLFGWSLFLGMLLVYIFVYCTSPHTLDEFMPSTKNRLLLQISGISTLLLCAHLHAARVLEKKQVNYDKDSPPGDCS